MRVIIAAAGEATRWGEYLGLPKHLAPTAAGEVLLSRTVAQARQISEDVHILTPADQRYELPPRRSRKVTWHEVPTHRNEYEHTRDLWSDADRTVLLLGDVYFTDEAMARIAAGSPSAYRVFGRYRASKVTGTPYGEIFAASWGPARHAQMDVHLAEVERLRAAGVCTRPPGWVLLRLWQGTPVRKHIVRPPIWVEIDDWTDDLDTPADYNRHPAFGVRPAVEHIADLAVTDPDAALTELQKARPDLSLGELVEELESTAAAVLAEGGDDASG